MLHTSDWHVGRRFKGIDLLDYQRRAFHWLEAVIVDQGVDVLCVSGDVYDLARPSAESVEVFDEAFSSLGATVVNGHPLEIVITPGNHDSARRLGVGSSLMRPNVHMRCRLEDVADPVVINRDGQRLAIYAIPYLDPDVARPTLRGLVDHDVERTHEGVMRAVLELVTADVERRRSEDADLVAVMMAHAFVSGALPSDSERSLTVGGVDSVPVALFANSGLDYLALGHLHRPQPVDVPRVDDDSSVFHCGRTPVARYSGSLMAYSFSERCDAPVVGNGKSVVVFDVSDGSIHDVRTVPVQSGQPALVRVEGTVEEALGDLAQGHDEDWVSVVIHATEYPRGIYAKIDSRYAHALEKQFVIDRSDEMDSGGRRMADLREANDEMDILDGFVRFMVGRDPHPQERAVLSEALTQVRGAGSEVAR